jgi:U4/U6.U5 tri-snRNP-associated protein 2
MATEREPEYTRAMQTFGEGGTEDDEDYIVPKKKFRSLAREDGRSRACPYLDTIDRLILDFDFEKVCSISLSNNNVYACLVCGKYFQGRGQKSHVHTHSVQMGHHVYLNLHTLKFYCLPDNYEIIDSSLEDIVYVLKPVFTEDQIGRMDRSSKWAVALDGEKYLPGIVGLNNIKANDYMNVILHVLAHVSPVRDYFLDEQSYAHIIPPPGDQNFVVVQRLGELIRKLWNSRSFKSHVSPHEMLQAVSSASKKRFRITEQGDPVDFLSWLLNVLHFALNGTKKPNSSLIYRTFQGTMKVYTRKLPPSSQNESELKELMKQEEYQEKASSSPFLYLSLDLPPPPLFQDELEKNIIPQVALFDLLSKFDGKSVKEYKTASESHVKRFELTKLPPFLILCIKRFTRNYFYLEKNPTIVNFPLKDIDMGEFLSRDPEVRKQHPQTKYNLVANICHDGQAGERESVC